MAKKNGAKQVPFRAWRIKAGYRTAEEFAAAAWGRGQTVQVGTAYTWDRGVIPRASTQGNLRRVFPGIRF